MKRHGAIAILDMLGTKSKWEEDIAKEFLNNIELLYKELDGIHTSIKKLESIDTFENLEFYRIMQNFENTQKDEIQEMPVLSGEDNKVLGIVTISDLVRLYDSEVDKILKVRKGNRSYGPHSADIDDDTSSTHHS